MNSLRALPPGRGHEPRVKCRGMGIQDVFRGEQPTRRGLRARLFEARVLMMRRSRFCRVALIVASLVEE